MKQVKVNGRLFGMMTLREHVNFIGKFEKNYERVSEVTSVLVTDAGDKMCW